MVSLDLIYDEIDSTIKEIADKLSNAEFVILTTTTSGHPVSYYSTSELTEEDIQSIASLLSAIGEGLLALLADLQIKVERDLIFLETRDTIFLIALLQKGTLTVKVRKPALLGTVRAIIKAYITKLDELLEKLDEAQTEMWKQELLKPVVPS